MATKTTTIGKGCDIRSRELLPRGGHRARDEDAELSSLEALIQAELNSNTGAIDAVESLDDFDTLNWPTSIL